MPEKDHEGHATSDLLAAYLDRRVDSAEAAFLEQHVPKCATCADDLAELESVRSVLRRLPQVRPPRSFVLPVEPLRRSDPTLFVPPDVWLRAAAALAALFFAMILSLDMLGFGAEAAVPSNSASVRAGAPAAIAPAATKAARGEARPASGDQAARPAESADATVSSLSATPGEPILVGTTPSPAIAPLRIASIVTGALALALLLGAFIARRRSSAG